MLMASFYSTHFLSLPRWHSNWTCYTSLPFLQLQHFGLKSKWGFPGISKKKIAHTLTQAAVNDNEVVPKQKTRRTSKRTRKKAIDDIPEENFELGFTDATNEGDITSGSSEDSKKTPQRTRRRAVSASIDLEEEKTEKIVRRGRKPKRKDDMIEQGSQSEISGIEESAYFSNEDDSEGELQLEKNDREDPSFTYGWPPLVCCFGAAQHSFVPSGRPANRLIDYEIHERTKDAFWAPDKFVRAPGGSAGSVAIALANLGGRVAFMGKIGDDLYGQAMLHYMNANNVQTRSVRIDSRRATAVSQMKIGKRGRLKMSCVKPCAEDSLSKSDINVDVLMEAKMFYLTTHSLLDRNMRSTTLQTVKIAKQLGAVIFYDVNLPLPLWESSEEAKILIREVWNLANIVEVTKQELEFLCGIKPTEEFDTKNNARSKFIHYGPEVVAPLWHENLKVLFVTNGTSKIHYYTEDHNGSVHGMEDAPITPFTGDMSASGDGIVAAIMRMLTVQPQLITDKGYLERTIKYAIDCGVIDQWLLGKALGFPPREDMEGEVEPDENGFRSISEIEYRTVKAVS